MTQETKTLREIEGVVDSIETFEGEGFLVHRPFPTRRLAHVDPFLLLDEMGPVDLGPGQAKGAPDHPHRGFETVTYMLEGAMEHKDSRGNSGRLGPGDVQWMTAGSGVVHSEMPSAEFARTGGRVHGFQLWVNLPQRDKMIAPRYQEIPASRIPEARTPDGAVRVRVIAGESLGVRAAIETHTPITYLHLTLEPGARFEQPLPEGYNAFAYVIRGRARLGPSSVAVSRGQIALFSANGEAISIEASDDKGGTQEALEVLVLGGRPLGEPIARYGPFVMNTQAEIHQAVEDYRNGRMGRIDF